MPISTLQVCLQHSGTPEPRGGKLLGEAFVASAAFPSQVLPESEARQADLLAHPRVHQLLRCLQETTKLSGMRQF